MKKWKKIVEIIPEFIRNNMRMPVIYGNYKTVKIVYQRDRKEMYPNATHGYLWT